MLSFKNSVIAGLALVAGAFSPAATAQTIQLYYAPDGESVGGAFTAVTDPNLYNANYSADALATAPGGAVGFQTFCVQTEVDFDPRDWGGPVYSYSTSLASVGVPNQYPLSVGTAYLYWQFASGQLHGYDYTGAARAQDDVLLQSAIWALQGGQTYSGYPGGTGNGVTGNPYYNLALAALGSAGINAPATLTDDYGVQILNLTALNGGPAAQNQLVYTGGGSNFHFQQTPDTGASVGVLALSLAVPAAFRRKWRVLRRGR